MQVCITLLQNFGNQQINWEVVGHLLEVFNAFPGFTTDGVNSSNCLTQQPAYPGVYVGPRSLQPNEPDFVPAQFATLPINVPLTSLGPCTSFALCLETTGCGAATILNAVTDVPISVIQGINAAIRNGAGVWTLGTDPWTMMTTILTSFVTGTATILIELFSLLDCLICAISGNVSNIYICGNGLFNTFQPLIILFANISYAIINFIVATERFFVMGLGDLFSGNSQGFINEFNTWLGSLWTYVIQPIVHAIVGYVLGLICVCQPFWNILVGHNNEWTCTNNNACSGGFEILKQGKRAAAGALDQAFLPDNFTLPDTQGAGHWLYQLFAADWPANMTSAQIWPANTPCLREMQALEPSAPDGLTDAQADLAAYCLGQAIIFDPARRADYLSAGSALAQTMDTCTATMLPLQWAADYVTMAPATQKVAQDCISERAYVVGAKRASGGYLDWLGDDTLTGGIGGVITHVMPLMADVSSAQLAVSQQNVDALHGGNPVFQQTLNETWGPDRAALASQQGTADLGSYVTVVLAQQTSGGDASQKRQAATTTAGAAWANAQWTRVAALAQILQAEYNDTIVNGQPHQLATNVLDQMIPLMSSLAPVPSVTDLNQVGIYNDTAGEMLWNMTLSVNSSVQSGGLTINHLNTMLASGILAVARFARPTPTTTRPSSLAGSPGATKKRGLLQAPAPISGLATLSASAGILARGLPMMVTDILSGRAAAKAAGVANVSTKINWVATTNYSNYGKYMLASSWGKTIRVAARPSSQPYVGFSTTPFFATLAERLTAVNLLRQQMTAATDPVATTLGERLGVIAQAIRSTWTRVHTLHQPLVVTPAEQVTPGTNGTDCLTNYTVLCEQCWALDQIVGYSILSVELPVGFFANTATPDFNTAQGMYNDFYNITAYLKQQNGTAIIGNSSANPVRFPALNTSAWAYVDDGIPGKIGFSDLQPLINETLAFIKSLFGNVTLTLGVASEAVTVLAAEASAAVLRGKTKTAPPSALRVQYEADLAAWQASPRLQAIRPRPLPPEYTTFVLGMRTLVTLQGYVSKFVPASVGTYLTEWANTPPNLSTRSLEASSLFQQFVDILTGWASWIFFQFISCDWGGDLLGAVMRMSLLEGLLLDVAIAVVWSFLILLFPPLLVITPSFTSATVLIVALTFAFSLSNGWAYGCTPALPAVFWSRQIMGIIVYQLFPLCPWVGPGLINEDTYTNDACTKCENWQSGMWTVASIEDLGLTGPLDVPTFFLYQFAPSWLAYFSNASNFNYPVNSIIASPSWQAWVTRWNGFNVQSDPITYSQYWTAIWLALIVWLTVVAFAVRLAQFLPVLSALKVFLAILLALILTAGLAIVAGFASLILMAGLPLEVMVLASKEGAAAGALM
jgi:hypothetical protein